MYSLLLELHIIITKHYLLIFCLVSVCQVNYLDAGEVDRTGHDSDQSSYKQSEEDSTEEESDDGDEYAGTCGDGRW